jgi:2-oxoisovalerate dehydrogenase E1 component
MPKSQMLYPEQLRKSGFIEFQPIPVNQYHKTLQ